MHARRVVWRQHVPWELPLPLEELTELNLICNLPYPLFQQIKRAPQP
jgi:hypothetical protein